MGFLDHSEVCGGFCVFLIASQLVKHPNSQWLRPICLLVKEMRQKTLIIYSCQGEDGVSDDTITPPN